MLKPPSKGSERNSLSNESGIYATETPSELMSKLGESFFLTF